MRRIEIDAIEIASPCTVPWDSMSGDDVKRFCGQCRLHVHDLSQMTRNEIGDLLRASDDTPCLRIWRRPDGRVVTKDCQRVRRAVRRRLRRVGAAAAGLLALVGIGGCGEADTPRAPNKQATPNKKATHADPMSPAPQESAPSTTEPPTKEKPPVPDATVVTGR